MTLRLPTDYLLPGDLARLESMQGVLIRTKAGGEIEWRQATREEIRSDSHRLMWYLVPGYYLELYGSPARLGSPNNVFGPRCAVECWRRMVGFFSATMGVEFYAATIKEWQCTRIDVTRNYALASSTEVLEALRCLSAVQGGHYRVQSHSGTVYWNKASSLRSGKAYHKGPHLAYQIKKRQADATPEEVALSERLLRLELALRGQFWRERAPKPWYEWSADELEAVHADYFGAMVGSIEVVEMNGLIRELEKVALTKGAAQSAYNTWLAIRAEGLENVRGRMSTRTFQRHKRLLFDAGLTWGDLQASNVIPLRRRTIELGAAVESWAELRRAA